MAAIPTIDIISFGCACRWNSADERVVTCERHQGWLDVVHEWAERAKVAEARVEQLEPREVEADRLLRLARDAANKIDIERQRGAGYNHAEVDWLLEEQSAIEAWIYPAKKDPK